MRIGIVACEVLKREIELVTSDDGEVVHREYVRWGLHDRPDDLRAAVVEKVNALEGRVDVVLLGYAICKSLGNVPEELALPCVMLREEDCLASMLGASEYMKEKEKCPGTWFSTPGWAELGLEGIVSDEQMAGLEEQGFTKLHFAKLQLDGYSRCLAIDTGVGGFDRTLEQTRGLADMIGLECESRAGDLTAIRKAWRDVKEGRWTMPGGTGHADA